MTTTIPVSENVKKLLEEFKGDMTWDEFLESLIHYIYRIRREKNREDLGRGFKYSYNEVRVKRWSREY